jgi:hypothetical protein
MSEGIDRSKTSGRPRSHLVLAVIWAVALAYVLRLSAGDRGIVDWVALGVIVAALVWQLWRLGARLHAAGGAPATGHEARVLAFWVVGLMNTALAVPGSEWTWKWWVGVALLVLAAADTVALYLRERRVLRAPDPA